MEPAEPSKSSQQPVGSPVAEVLYTGLNAIGIFGLVNVLNSIQDGLSGFDDLAAAIGLFMQLVLVLFSLPFALRAARRDIQFSWTRYLVAVPATLLVLAWAVLLGMGATVSDNLILMVLVTGVNLLPLLVFLLNR